MAFDTSVSRRGPRGPPPPSPAEAMFEGLHSWLLSPRKGVCVCVVVVCVCGEPLMGSEDEWFTARHLHSQSGAAAGALAVIMKLMRRMREWPPPVIALVIKRVVCMRWILAVISTPLTHYASLFQFIPTIKPEEGRAYEYNGLWTPTILNIYIINTLHT